MFNPKKADGVNLTCQFNIDKESFWIRINNNEITTLEGIIEGSDISLSMDEPTFLGLGDGSTDIELALQSGQIQLDGAIEKLMLMLNTLTN